MQKTEKATNATTKNQKGISLEITGHFVFPEEKKKKSGLGDTKKTKTEGVTERAQSLDLYTTETRKKGEMESAPACYEKKKKKQLRTVQMTDVDQERKSRAPKAGDENKGGKREIRSSSVQLKKTLTGGEGKGTCADTNKSVNNRSAQEGMVRL